MKHFDCKNLSSFNVKPGVFDVDTSQMTHPDVLFTLVQLNFQFPIVSREKKIIVIFPKVWSVGSHTVHLTDENILMIDVSKIDQVIIA